MFSYEISQIFKSTFFYRTLWWLLLKGVCQGTSLVKILQSCHSNIFRINHRCFRKMPIKKNNELSRLLKSLSFLLFELFSSKKLCVFIIFISFFETLSNFCNRILTNQKSEFVIRNCQWNCMENIKLKRIIGLLF